MADIVSKLFSDNDESESAKVDKNVIQSDATTFGKKKEKKAKLTGKERTRAQSFAEILTDVFFERKDSEKQDTSLETKVSGNTPAAEARKPVSGGSGKMPKKGGILGKLKGVGGAVGGIVAAAGALALLVGVGPIPGVLPNLAKIDWGTIGKAFIILGGLALVGKLMGQGGKGMIFMAGALAILVGVGPIPGVLENMANIDWGTIGKAFVILGGLGVVGKLMQKGSYGILAAAAALAILAGIGPIPGALENLANIEWGTVAKAFVILGGLAIAGNVMKKGAVGLLLGAAALTLLVRGALVPLQEIEWSTIGKAVVGILALGAVAALAGLVAGPIALGALALGLLGLALIPITYSLKGFQELEWETLGKAFVGLLVIGAVGAVLGIATPLILAGSFALTALGIALIPLAAGIALIVPSFELFIPLLEKLSEINAAQMLLLGPALIGLSAGLLALVAGETIGKVLDGLGSLFGGEGPLDKLIKLGNVAEPILKLKDGLDSLGEIDLDDLKITGEPEVAVDGIDMITSAVYSLLYAQQKSVNLFKQMYSGPPTTFTSVLDKLFNRKPKEEDSPENTLMGKITELIDKISEGTSKTVISKNDFAGELEDYGSSGSDPTGSIFQKLFGDKNKSSERISPIHRHQKRIERMMETISIQMDKLANYGKLTVDNTGNTVKAIKEIKIGDSSVMPLAGSAPQTMTSSPESLPNSRADYSLSPYSLNVPST